MCSYYVELRVCLIEKKYYDKLDYKWKIVMQIITPEFWQKTLTSRQSATEV